MAERQRTVMVLGGGVGLGAYHAGAYARLRAAGLEPEWIAGSSVGAVTAAVIASTPADLRVEQLMKFWGRLVWPAASLDPGPGPLSRLTSLASVLSTRLTGHPALFTMRAAWPGALMPGDPARQAMYGLEPLKRLLHEFVDFDRLNRGPMRLTVCATDLATGEPVMFDTARERIGMEHLLASSGFLPDFPPVRIGDRWLGDGGLSMNAPLLPILEEESGDLTCFLLDLYAPPGRVPSSIDQALERRYDLLFASQTRATVRAEAEIGRLRATLAELMDRMPPAARASLPTELRELASNRRVELFHLAYAETADDSGTKAFDFSAPTLRRRWTAGERDMDDAIDRLRSLKSGQRPAGVHVHSFGAATPAGAAATNREDIPSDQPERHGRAG